MTAHRIPVELRSAQGKGASRRLRRAGFVPAIVYGGGLPPRAIQLESRIVAKVAENEWFYSAILDLDLHGDVQKVLLRDLQRHPARGDITHLDFQRVMETEKLRKRVPIHFLNQEKSPAGKTSGVVISHNLTDVEVVCYPKDLPEYLELDLAELKPGDVVHLSQIPLPPGVEIPELRLGKDHDVTVVSARYVNVQEEAPQAPAPPSEPEKK